MAKILIVEDDELYRDIYKSIFSDMDYSIVVVESGQLGIDAALADKPDLIIMDIIMPHMSGIEAIKRIRTERSIQNIPILAVTTMEDVITYDEIYEAGGNGFIKKPIQADKLISRITEML